MSSDKHCCVPGCKDSGDMHAVLHGFPNPDKDRIRFNTWLYSIGFASDLLKLDNEHIFKFRRVCRKHFLNKYLCRYNRISNIAVPTLYLPGLTLNPKSACVGRKPLEGLANQPIPSTSTAPESHHQFLYTATNTTEKENIDPETVILEQMPPSTSQTTKQNLGRKISTRTVQLSKAERNLQLKIRAAKKIILKLKNKNKKQTAEIKAAKKIVANPAVLDVLQNCSSTAKLLMRIQWREDKKKDKGRRFTLQEKIAALSVFKQSPKAYRFLRKIFILPANQTLAKVIQKCNLRPGLNKNIFSQLKKKAEKVTISERLCILLFDEVHCTI